MKLIGTGWRPLAMLLAAAAAVLILGSARAQAPPPNNPPPGAYQPIPNFTGTGAGALFRKAINDRFAGVQPIAPEMIELSFANLPPETDGSVIYCSDCMRAAACAGGGPGAFAFGQQGQWACAPGGGGTITAVSAGANLVGGGTAGSVSVALVPLPALSDSSPLPAAGNLATAITTAQTISINAPAGIASGHVEVASILFQDTLAITPPTGWTLIRSDGGAQTGQQLNEYCHTAGGSEPSTYAWTKASNDSAIEWGVIVDIAGASGCPVDANSGAATTSAGSVSIPSATASGVPELVLAFGDSPGIGGSTVSFSKGTPFGINFGEPFGAASFPTTSLTLPSVTATGPSGAFQMIAALVALKGSGTFAGPPVLQGDDYAQVHKLQSTVQDGSSTISGYVINRKYDVRAFGALGDGATDDTTAIQNAYNAACTAAVANVGATRTVYFPQGNYHTSFPILMNCASAVSLAGDGDDTSALTGGGTNPEFPALFNESSGYVAALGTHSATSLASGSGSALSWDQTHAYFYSLKDAGISQDAHPLNGLSAFSFETFLNFPGAGSANNGGAFFIASSTGVDAWTNNTGHGAGFALYVTQHSTASDLTGCLNISTGGQVCVTGPNAIANGTTTEIELSYDGSTLRLFAGGALAASAAASGTVVQQAAESFLLGDYPNTGWPFAFSGSNCCGTADNHWVGQLDSIRISNVARHTTAYTAPTAKFSSDGSTLLLINGTTFKDAFVKVDVTNAGSAWIPAYAYNNLATSPGTNNTRIEKLLLNNFSYGLLSAQAGIFGTLDHLRVNGTLVGVKLWGVNYGWDIRHLDVSDTSNGEANFEALGAGSTAGLMNVAYINMSAGYYGMVLADGDGTFTRIYDNITSNHLNTLNAGALASGLGSYTFIDPILDAENGGSAIPIKLFGGGTYTIINGDLQTNAGNSSLYAIELDPSANLMRGVSLFNTPVSAISASAPELVKINNSANLATPVTWQGCTVNGAGCDQSAIPLSNDPTKVQLAGGSKTNKLQGLTLSAGTLLSSVTDSVANTTPTLSSCGTGASVAAGGTSNAFVVTVGTPANIASCTVSFGSAAQFKNPPVCTATDISTFQSIKVTSPSASGITLAAQTNMSGDLINVNCMGK